MGSIKLKIHPLFIIVGIVYVAIGKTLIFVVYTLSALLHEIGHSIVAGNLGYTLNKITLMPFGAVVRGDIEGLRCVDQIKIAIAGPLLNLAIAFFFIATWWIVPETYAYTDIVVLANLSLFLINMLPLLPLDGGRVINCLISLKFSKKTANFICKGTGITLSIGLFALFVISCFTTFNISLLFFSLFAILGTLEKGADNKYVRIYSAVKTERLKRGMRVKRQAVDKSVKLKKIIQLMDAECINELAVYEFEKEVALLSQDKINDILSTGDLYSPISKYL